MEEEGRSLSSGSLAWEVVCTRLEVPGASLGDGGEFLYLSDTRRCVARGDALLCKLSVEGESKYLGVLLPDSVPVLEIPPTRKSPGVGVAQVSTENMSGGATMSYSSLTPLLLREMGAEGNPWI